MSTYDKVIGNTSLSFTRTKDNGRVAFKAYMAIWRNGGDHTILAAPTLDELAKVWEPIVGQPLIREDAQEVFIVAARGSQ